MAGLVNQDGNVISGTVNTDRDASALASYLDGPRRDPYYESGRSLSKEDEEVHEAYEALLRIVKNPRNFTESQIVDTIVAITEADDSPVQKYGSFSGNYNADLADRDSNVYKYWRNYKSKKKNRRNLGQQISYLLGKVDEILKNEGYKEDERFSAAAYVPREMTARQAKAAAAIRGLPNISALKLRAKQRKEERRKRMEAAAVTSTSKPKAEASAKSSAKPSVKVITRPSGDEEEWIGPFTSRSTGKQYWTRKKDNFSVYVSSNGELTEGKIRATEAAKAKAEAKKAAAKRATKKGGRRTRKKRGKGKQNERKPPKSKKNRNPTEERVAKAIEAAKKKQADRIAGLRQSALVVPDDGLEHNDNFAAGIFDPNAPTEDEFSSGIGVTDHEINEGAAAAAAVDVNDGSGWGQFSSEGFNGGRRKTRKMKGGHHLYKRLGVSKYASQKQIKKAYNKLKKKKKLTQKVKYAYKILSKKKSRKKYNAKYKKMKKSKKKRRRRGGIASIVIKGKMHPGNYEPHFNIPDGNANQPAWLGNL